MTNTYSGIPGDEISDITKQKIAKDFEARLHSLIVDVSDDTVRQGYDHYCKRMLWPLFHYQIPDSPKTKIYEEQSYRSVSSEALWHKLTVIE